MMAASFVFSIWYRPTPRRIEIRKPRWFLQCLDIALANSDWPQYLHSHVWIWVSKVMYEYEWVWLHCEWVSVCVSTEVWINESCAMHVNIHTLCCVCFIYIYTDLYNTQTIMFVYLFFDKYKHWQFWVYETNIEWCVSSENCGSRG